MPKFQSENVGLGHLTPKVVNRKKVLNCQTVNFQTVPQLRLVLSNFCYWIREIEKRLKERKSITTIETSGLPSPFFFYVKLYRIPIGIEMSVYGKKCIRCNEWVSGFKCQDIMSAAWFKLYESKGKGYDEYWNASIEQWHFQVNTNHIWYYFVAKQLTAWNCFHSILFIYIFKESRKWWGMKENIFRFISFI